MRITDWPEQERPRERLLARGAGELSDAELLAILLRTGSRGLTAVDLQERILSVTVADWVRYPAFQSDPATRQPSPAIKDILAGFECRVDVEAACIEFRTGTKVKVAPSSTRLSHFIQ